MKKTIIIFLLCGISVFGDFSVSSGIKQNVMIELYSSQGCSSCPVAEKWLNNFVDNPDLWTKYIPLNFHVTYWDRLGWKDTFAKEVFTQKQYAYKKQGYVEGVYTPGFVINAKEWRGWFDQKENVISISKRARLLFSFHNKKLEIAYNSAGAFDVYVALLGFGLETKVRKGENRGQVLKHNFVVLKMNKQSMQGSKAQMPLLKSKIKAKRYALVTWVTPKDSLDILQSTGSWLD